jgi:thiamine-monophosphate kinase
VAHSDQGSAEDHLIAKYFRPLATAPGAFGLTDDAAILTPPPGCDLVLTTDGVISGVHFMPHDPPGLVACKVLRMNLSDLAAKGAKPAGFLLSIALPPRTEEKWIASFARGLGEAAIYFDCPLLGGDTDHTEGPLSATIAAFGTVPHGKMVRRSTAKSGDAVVVTGTIGDSALGLLKQKDNILQKRWQLTEDQSVDLKARYLVPEPRVALADAVLRHAAAAMDVSDGLVGDLAKLCRASGVSAEVDVARVPLSDAAQAALAADPALIETILTGGDDYEILLTLPPDRLDAFRAAAQEADVEITQIGRIAAGEGAQFIRDGKPLTFARQGYSHF